MNEGFNFNKTGEGAGNTFGKGIYFATNKEEIEYWNHYIQTIKSPFLKKLYQPINVDEVCLELVDIEGSRANELLMSYFIRQRKEFY